MSEEIQSFFSELVCEPVKENLLHAYSEKALLRVEYRNTNIWQDGKGQPAPQADITMCSTQSNGSTRRNGRRMPANTAEHPDNGYACESATDFPVSCDRGQNDKPKSGPFLVILTAEQARTIYLLRSESTSEGISALSVAGKSSLVSEMFGVSPKTIRDVWNRKTWTQVPFDKLIWADDPLVTEILLLC